jgi:hypothetical protein
MFKAMCNVAPSHLLDESLFDFKNLTTESAKRLDVLQLG